MRGSHRRVRSDLPFRRVAVVLAGGGALGAYEVGVLHVLERAGVRPAILAGASVGAINAVLWLAHGLRTKPLRRVWMGLQPATVGLRWATLTMRALGAFLVTLAVLQTVFILIGSPELSPPMLLAPHIHRPHGLASALLDILAWVMLAVLGLLVMHASRRAETPLARLSPPRDPRRLQRWFGRALLLGAALHVLAWATGLPWPHRFGATVLLLGGLAWLASRIGRARAHARGLFLRLLPETGGRGLWGSDARRRLIQQMVGRGDPGLLVSPETHVIICACPVDTGRMTYFVNWPEPGPDFRARIAEVLGEVTPLRTADEVVEAAVASSAIPGVFEPVCIGDREFVDGGVFSNQALHAVLADGADAVVVVLVSPRSGPPAPRQDAHLFELVARLLEIANWRSLQSDLRALPGEWLRGAELRDASGRRRPARVCVVEPASLLPGGLYGFSPDNAADLYGRGERDAWRALAEAGWIEEGAATAPAGTVLASEAPA